jgi:ribosome-binding ATPase
MALQCGIIGIANSGKTTLFNCMSSTKAQASSFAFSSSKSNVGIINVPDQRLYELEKLQPTERIVHATVEMVDIPGLAKGANKGEGVGNRFLSDIRNTDALIHVIRCFDDEKLPHIEGSVDPVRDIETVEFELQVKDLESVEKKITRLDKMARVGDKDAKHGLEVLLQYKQHLESLQSARTAPVDEKDRKYIEDIFLLSAKPVLFVCNVDESSVINGNKYVDQVRNYLAGQKNEIIVLAAKLESEIAELEKMEDRMAFLKDIGLDEPGMNKLIRSAFHLLNLHTFLTVGPKEIRAWTIKTGMNAQQAAGVIHSDLERGFIRAEVIKYTDFIRLGSENACKEKGKLSVEGKNYVVEDGDLLNIRFNV